MESPEKWHQEEPVLETTVKYCYKSKYTVGAVLNQFLNAFVDGAFMTWSGNLFQTFATRTAKLFFLRLVVGLFCCYYFFY
jgi:hypothetical protein